MAVCSHSSPHPTHRLVHTWITAQGVTDPEALQQLEEQKVTLDNMKYLKDNDLVSFGISNWTVRMAILEAIQQYHQS